MTAVSKKARDQIVWHYTTGESFIAIVESGAIRPATKFISPGERPIVWFSAENHWEPTANKSLVLATGEIRRSDINDMIQFGKGLVRFGVSRRVVLHDWKALQRKARMRPEVARALERAGRDVGANPQNWYGCFRPVVRAEWEKIDIYKDGAWIPIEVAAANLPESRKKASES